MREPGAAEIGRPRLSRMARRAATAPLTTGLFFWDWMLGLPDRHQERSLSRTIEGQPATGTRVDGVNEIQIVQIENEMRCAADSSSGTQITRYSGSRPTTAGIAGRPGCVAAETNSVNANPRRPR